MPDGYPIQTNFTSGEVSPYLFGRTDTNKYFNGAAILQNFIVKPQGGIVRRSGTRFVAEVKDSTKLTILRRFVFSSSQAYVLEFGNQYIRFYRNGGQIQVASVPVEVATPYLSADLRTLSFAQSADVLYIAHPNYAPMQLSRLSDTSWTLTATVTSDGPYLSVTPTYNTQTPARLTAKLVSDSAIAVSNNPIFSLPGTVKTIQNVTTDLSAVPGPAIQIQCNGHGFANGNTVAIAGCTGVGNINSANGTWIITVIDANNFYLRGSGIIIGIYSGGGTAALAPSAFLGVEYRQNNIWKLAKMVQATSTTQATVTIVDAIITPDPTVLITASGSGTTVSITANFSIFTTNNVNQYIRATAGGWYLITTYNSPTNVTATQLNMVLYTPPYPATIVTVNNLTRITTLLVTSDQNVFASTDVGRLLRLNILSVQIPCTITAYNSATSVTCQALQPLPLDPSNNTQPSNGGLATDWRIGAWSVTTGYPSAIVFHQQRLCYAGTPTEPQTINMSKSGDYYNFAPTNLDSTVSDDNAINITIASQDVNKIIWLSSGPVLLVGTVGGEWLVKSSSLVAPLTPTDVDVSQQTAFGSTQIQPLKSGVTTLFVQRSGQKVREMLYNFQFDQYEAKDVTVVSEHIIRQSGRAVDASYAQEPNSLYWVVTDGGALVSFTYYRDQEVYAWHNHPIGGSGFVEAIASIPSVDQKSDTTYLIVKRDLGVVGIKRYVEFFEAEFSPQSTTDSSTMYFLDCFSEYNGTPINAVTGLSYIDRQQVMICADGSVRQTPGIITTGSISFDGEAASHVIVGFQYPSIFKMMPLEGGSQGGTAQGKIKRVDKLVLRLLNSLGFEFGESLSKLEIASFRDTLDPMDAAPKFFTGDIERKFSSSYSRQAPLYIQQDQPYPLTVICIMPHEVTTSS